MVSSRFGNCTQVLLRNSGAKEVLFCILLKVAIEMQRVLNDFYLTDGLPEKLFLQKTKLNLSPWTAFLKI